MSRTHRKTIRVLRNPKTNNTRINEYYAYQEMIEAGYKPSNREQVRGNLNCTSIPSSWDDLLCASFDEVYQPDYKVYC